MEGSNVREGDFTRRKTWVGCREERKEEKKEDKRGGNNKIDDRGRKTGKSNNRMEKKK